MILSKFANLSLPIHCTFLVVREYYINKFKPSVIALQEIWNKPQNLEFILENYHHLHFRIRDKQ